jgi:immune inhibitor A
MHSHDDRSGRVQPGPVFCAIAPSPQLRERMRSAAGRAAVTAGVPLAPAGQPRRFGFNDGVILPPDRFAAGASPRSVRQAAAQRAPLRGTVRVVVVLAEFSDRALSRTAAEFEQLFFSTGELATGSVTEYYREVTGGLVEIAGEVVGPVTMPQTLEWYANGNFGIGKPSGEPRANVLARDAAAAVDPVVDFGPYDNDGNGYVDAFIVVHAGSGGEETGDPSDIWSHKWVLPAEYEADSSKIFAYLTIPEDAKLGVSAHELGHLLFGFPDLYDIDGTSEGLGNWCLMAAGSWNGGGDTPAHPSAWCKANQGWVDVENTTAASTLSIPAVGDGRRVFRLWADGAPGPEYFLVENRQRTGFDRELPGDGLCVFHVDERQADNSDESHYLVGLLQADGAADLEHGSNRGDAGDVFPGSGEVTKLDGTTTPGTLSYAGQETGVAVLDISASGPVMTASVRVGASAGDETGHDLAVRVGRAEERVNQLQQAVLRAAADLAEVGTAGLSAWSHRSRT